MQIASFLRRIILSCLTCLDIPYFSSLSHKRHSFRTRILNVQYVFWFSVQLSAERIQRDIIYLRRYSCKLPVILIRFYSDLNFLYNFFFEKSSNIKFHENPSSESRVVPWGQTDGHDEANRLFFFCNFANARTDVDLRHFSQKVVRVNYLSMV